MKSNLLSLIVTLVLLIIVGSFLVINRINEGRQMVRSNDPIPYIYYFSDLEHAFVIERADGTDSRLLAQGVMPEDHNVIDSVNWSPSGEYLAWRSHRYNGPGVYTISGWLIHSDGANINQYWDDAEHVYLMEWSPTEDILIVAYRPIDSRATTFKVISPRENQILSELTISGFIFAEPPFYYSLPSAWTSDGSEMMLFGVSVDDYSAMLITLSKDGVIKQVYYDEYNPAFDFSHHRLLHQTNDSNQSPSWIITDMVTGQSQSFRTFDHISDMPPNRQFDVIWSTNLDYALIVENECQRRGSGYYGCSTDNISLFDWNNGTHNELPDFIQIPERYAYYADKPIWSSFAPIALLYDSADETYILFDAEMQEIYNLGFDYIYNYDWLPDSDVLISGSDTDNLSRGLYRFDWQTHTLSFMDISDQNNTFDSDLSPNNDYVGFTGGRNVMVESLVTGERFTYPYHSAGSFGSGPVTGYVWHESNEWFFSSTNTQFAGSCCNREAIMIHYKDDSFGRELTLCHGLRTCAGFLPDRILPFLADGQVYTYIPQPELILAHEREVRGLAWHNDGSLLATYSDTYDEGRYITVWQLTESNVSVLYETEVDISCGDINHCIIEWNSNNILTVYESYWDGRNGSYVNNQYLINIETDTITAEAINDFNWWYSPDAEFLLELDEETQQTYLLHSESHTRLSTKPLENYADIHIYYIDYDRDSDLAVGSTPHGRGRLWEVSTGELLTELNWTGYMAQFNPNGTQVAVASSRFVSIWDMTIYQNNN